MSEYTYGNLLLAKDAELCKKYLDPGAYLIKLNEKWACLLNEQDKYFMDDITARPVSENVLALSKQTPLLFFANPEDHGFGFAIMENGETTSSIYFDHEAHWDIFAPEAGDAVDFNMIRAEGLLKALNFDEENIKSVTRSLGMNMDGLEEFKSNFTPDNKDLREITGQQDSGTADMSGFLENFGSNMEKVQAMQDLADQMLGRFVADKFAERAGARDTDPDRGAYFDKVLANFNPERFRAFGYSDAHVVALKALLTPENISSEPLGIADRFKEILGLESMSFVAWDYIRFDEEEERERVFPIIAKG